MKKPSVFRNFQVHMGMMNLSSEGEMIQIKLKEYWRSARIGQRELLQRARKDEAKQ